MYPISIFRSWCSTWTCSNVRYTNAKFRRWKCAHDFVISNVMQCFASSTGKNFLYQITNNNFRTFSRNFLPTQSTVLFHFINSIDHPRGWFEFSINFDFGWWCWRSSSIVTTSGKRKTEQCIVLTEILTNARQQFRPEFCFKSSFLPAPSLPHHRQEFFEVDSGNMLVNPYKSFCDDSLLKNRNNNRKFDCSIATRNFLRLKLD